MYVWVLYRGGGGGGGGDKAVKIISSEEQEHTGKVMNLEYSFSVPVV